jgi:hypothetical protein
MALAEICVCAQTVILVRPSWRFCTRFGRRSTTGSFLTRQPRCVRICQTHNGKQRAFTEHMEGIRRPRKPSATPMPAGDSTSSTEPSPSDTAMHLDNSCKVAKKEKRRIYYERYVLSLHRHPTSARSPHSPTTFSRYPLFFARSPLSLLYHPPRPQRWRGRRLSNIAS